MTSQQLQDQKKKDKKTSDHCKPVVTSNFGSHKVTLWHDCRHLHTISSSLVSSLSKHSMHIFEEEQCFERIRRNLETYTSHVGSKEKRRPCLNSFATGYRAYYALQSPQASCNCTEWWRQHWLTECRCTLWQMYRQHAASAGLSGPGAFPAPRLLLVSSTQAKASSFFSQNVNESILLPI